MTNFNYVPLVEVTRGPIVESIHYGSLAVVDASGHLVASYGDPNLVTYLRSSSKPIQVLPFIEFGGAEAYGLTDREISVMCASHFGTDEHVKVVSGIQAKVGLHESDLLCGTHPAIDEATRDALLLRGERPTPNRHNCSGKHTGFLAHAVLREFSKEDYINPEHPLQKIIVQTFAEMVDVPANDIHIGIDGCSAPVFGIPLYNGALGFAKLCDPSQLTETRAAACRKITHAITSHPDMIAGPGEFDTVLMEACDGKVVVKGGAEGYQALGVLPGAFGPNSPALGITLKISDGDNTGRARAIVSIEVLRQLGVLSQETIDARLAKFAARPVKNWRKLDVGVIRPVFQLDFKFS